MPFRHSSAARGISPFVIAPTASDDVEYFDFSITIPTGSGITGVQNPVLFSFTITETDLTTADMPSSGVKSYTLYGAGGAASKGNAHGFTSDIQIQGQGLAEGEQANFAGVLRYEIGTGYTQTGGPAGSAWFTDWTIHSAVAVQHRFLGALNILVNNHYNGQPTLGPSSIAALVTKPGTGGGLDAGHSSATTYPVGVGLVVTGEASSTNSAFLKGIQVGGTAALWEITNPSPIDTGLEISHYKTRGIYVSGKHSTAGADAPAIQTADALDIFFGGSTKLGGSDSLVEIQSTTSRNPILFLGSTTNDQYFALWIRNGQGVGILGVSGGADHFITGSASGDFVVQNTSTGKSILFGGTTRVLQVTADNKFGAFAVTPIARPLVPTGSTTDQVITALQNLGWFRQS
jgi:hypothetical protein